MRRVRGDDTPALGSGDARETAAWPLLLGAAILLGVFADIGQRAPDPWGAIPELGLPWVLLALFWGWSAPTSILGPLGGVVGITLALASYVGFKAIAYGEASVDGFLRHDIQYWLLIAVLVGTISGGAGRWLRMTDHRRELGWAFGIAAALAEGGSLLALMLHDGGHHPAMVLASAEVALGAGWFAFVGQRSRRLWLTLAVTAWLIPGFIGGLLVFGGHV